MSSNPHQSPLLVSMHRTHETEDAAPPAWVTHDGQYRLIHEDPDWHVYSVGKQRILATWRSRKAAVDHLTRIYGGK